MNAGRALPEQFLALVRSVVDAELSDGFIVVTANDIDEACEIAKGCPIFEQGGGVEVRPAASMTP